MCAFRFSQFVKKEQSSDSSASTPPPEPQPVVAKPLLAEDRLNDESIKNLRGLDNLIKELRLEPDEDLINDSKFFAGCMQLGEVLQKLGSAEECELAWPDICRKVEQLGLAIDEEFGAFWIEALDADFSQLDSGDWRHNINACIISLELAAALKYSTGDRFGIAAAALLYNIGTPANAREELSKSEALELIDRSVKILKKSGAPADMLRAVSECYERTDGSGTPRNLKGPQISLKGQLLGMAVAFERLFRKEQASFKEQGTAFQPVMQMLSEHRNHFNPQVLKSLLLTSGFYQVGAIVELNSGALARVITQNPGAPLRPLVEVVLDRAGNHPVRRQILDLRDNLTLSIVRTVAKGT